MGRTPTPTALKALRGTRRPDRESGQEPTPPALELGPTAPSWVRGRRARLAWRDVSTLLTEQKILTVLDAMSLGLLVEAFGDYLAAGDVIEKSGPYYESVTYDNDGGIAGRIIRRHPAVDDRKDAWMRVERLLGKFGMNPAERSRVKATVTQDADPWEEYMRGRRKPA